MTRKDYEAIASRLREYREEVENSGATMANRYTLDTLDDVVEILVDFFTEDNPRFTPNRFRQATR
jgi:hypothetical protein